MCQEGETLSVSGQRKMVVLENVLATMLQLTGFKWNVVPSTRTKARLKTSAALIFKATDKICPSDHRLSPPL